MPYIPDNRAYSYLAAFFPLRRNLVVVDYFVIALNMSVVLLVAFGISNLREVQALWQMQRHALVKYFKLATRPARSRGRVPWLIARARWLGLLPSPPMQNGRAVEPVVVDEPVPSLQYFRSFTAWRVYTSPQQLNVEFAILVVEMAVVWGLLGLLLAQ